MLLLKGKTAIVTGGTTGIGRGIVLEYLRQGCNVAVNHLGLSKDSQHKDSLLENAREMQQSARKSNENELPGDIVEIAGDVTNPNDCATLVHKTVEKFGKLDVMVANAGVFRPAALLDVKPDLLEHTVKVNVIGAFYACQAAARQMVKQGHGGSIIGISSISALQGGRMQTHYTPTKAGVLSLMQSMAISLGEHQIRCNALLPGTIRSQLSAEEIADKQRRERLLAKIPLGRHGEPQDIAGPAVFLACEKMSGFVTGAGLLVDGGMYAYLQ